MITTASRKRKLSNYSNSRPAHATKKMKTSPNEFQVTFLLDLLALSGDRAGSKPWTQNEIHSALAHFSQFRPKDDTEWDEFAKNIPERTGKQCKQIISLFLNAHQNRIQNEGFRDQKKKKKSSTIKTGLQQQNIKKSNHQNTMARKTTTTTTSTSTTTTSTTAIKTNKKSIANHHHSNKNIYHPKQQQSSATSSSSTTHHRHHITATATSSVSSATASILKINNSSIHNSSAIHSLHSTTPTTQTTSSSSSSPSSSLSHTSTHSSSSHKATLHHHQHYDNTTTTPANNTKSSFLSTNHHYNSSSSSTNEQPLLTSGSLNGHYRYEYVVLRVKDSIDMKSYANNTPLTIRTHAFHAHASTPLSAVHTNPTLSQRKEIIRKRAPQRKKQSKKKETENRHILERNFLQKSLELKVKNLENDFTEEWNRISERFPKLAKAKKTVSDFLEIDCGKENMAQEWLDFVEEINKTEKTFCELQKRLAEDQEKIVDGLFTCQQQELKSIGVCVVPSKSEIKIEKTWDCPSWFVEEYQVLKKVFGGEDDACVF